MAPIHALLLCGLHAVTGTDMESMIQQSLIMAEQPAQSFDSIMDRRMSDSNVTWAAVRQAMERDLPLIKGEGSLKNAVGGFIREASKTLKGEHERLREGLADFVSNTSDVGTIEGLLRKGEAFFRESGALDRLKAITQTEWKHFQQSWPLFDSFVFGFEVPKLTPSLQKELPSGITGGTGRIFVNMNFEGVDVRICLSAAAQADPNANWKSQFEKEKEKATPKLYETLPRINPFAGVAKWKNLPSWSFGVQAFLNLAFVGPSDLGWKWSLSKEPETACYFFDICTAGCNRLKVHQPSALQTDDELVAAEVLQPEGSLVAADGPVVWPIRVPTFVEHTWCTEDLDTSDEDAICYTDYGEVVNPRCISGDGNWYSVKPEWVMDKCDDSRCVFRCHANGTAFYSDLGSEYGWGELHPCRSADYTA